MRQEPIMDALSLVRDDFLLEAEKVRLDSPKVVALYWLKRAACLAVVVTLFLGAAVLTNPALQGGHTPFKPAPEFIDYTTVKLQGRPLLQEQIDAYYESGFGDGELSGDNRPAPVGFYPVVLTDAAPVLDFRSYMIPLLSTVTEQQNVVGLVTLDDEGGYSADFCNFPNDFMRAHWEEELVVLRLESYSYGDSEVFPHFIVLLSPDNEFAAADLTPWVKEYVQQLFGGEQDYYATLRRSYNTLKPCELFAAKK